MTAETFFFFGQTKQIEEPNNENILSRQHLIYSITPDSGPSQLSVILSVSTTMASNARLWNIRIYQVEAFVEPFFPITFSI